MHSDRYEPSGQSIRRLRDRSYVDRGITRKEAGFRVRLRTRARPPPPLLRFMRGRCALRRCRVARAGYALNSASLGNARGSAARRDAQARVRTTITVAELVRATDDPEGTIFSVDKQFPRRARPLAPPSRRSGKLENLKKGEEGETSVHDIHACLKACDGMLRHRTTCTT